MWKKYKFLLHFTVKKSNAMQANEELLVDRDEFLKALHSTKEERNNAERTGKIKQINFADCMVAHNT